MPRRVSITIRLVVVMIAKADPSNVKLQWLAMVLSGLAETVAFEDSLDAMIVSSNICFVFFWKTLNC